MKSVAAVHQRVLSRKNSISDSAIRCATVIEHAFKSPSLGNSIPEKSRDHASHSRVWRARIPVQFSGAQANRLTYCNLPRTSGVTQAEAAVAKSAISAAIKSRMDLTS